MRPRLAEKHFEQQVRDYLEKVEGWRCFHFEEVWAEERKRTFGEAGMPDLLAIRYAWFGGLPRTDDRVVSEVLWCELKRPGAKPRANQRLWKIHEQKLGALVVTAGEDFAADYDSFLKWYEASGLKRR